MKKRGKGCGVSKDSRDSLSKEQMRSILRKIKDDLQKEYVRKYGKSWETHWLSDNGIKTGKGIVDVVKNAISFLRGLRTRFSASGRKLLERYGNEAIKQIVVFRQPLSQGVRLLLNVLSTGKFDKRARALRLSDVYHVGMVLVLESGKKLLSEKNSVPELTENLSGISKNAQIKTIQVNKKITVAEYFSRGIKSAPSEKMFWEYNPENATCFHYVLWNLKGNGLLSAEIRLFIEQPSESLFKTVPGITGDLVKKLLALVSRGDVLIKGGGVGIWAGDHPLLIKEPFLNKNNPFWREYQLKEGKGGAMSGLKSGKKQEKVAKEREKARKMSIKSKEIREKRKEKQRETAKKMVKKNKEVLSDLVPIFPLIIDKRIRPEQMDNTLAEKARKNAFEYMSQQSSTIKKKQEQAIKAWTKRNRNDIIDEQSRDVFGEL